MSVLSLVIIFSSLLAIMAIGMPDVPVGANIQARGYIAGIMALAASPSPTATPSVVPKVGIPIQQTTTMVGKVGAPLHQNPQVGTPIAVATVTATTTSTSMHPMYTHPLYSHPMYSQPSFYSQHSVAVILVSVFAALLFLSLVGIIVWRVLHHRKINKKEVDVDEEDAMEAYAKFWKKKRDSGGITEKENK